MKRNETVIRGNVLADQVCYDKHAGYQKDWNLNGEQVTLSVEKQS